MEIGKELFYEAFASTFKVLVEDDPNISEAAKAILEAIGEDDDITTFALIYVIAYAYFTGAVDERTNNKERTKKIDWMITERMMGNDK